MKDTTQKGVLIIGSKSHNIPIVRVSVIHHQQTVDAARELKEQLKKEKEMKCCVDRLKQRCKELEHLVD